MPRMAYVPPPGDKLVEANSCYLVWLPDAAEYRAAFWGTYSALADYWLWDAPDPDDQADIQTSWLAAIGNTLEALDMGCLESLTDMMRQVRDAIIANACCPPGSQYVQYNNWDILVYGDDEAIPESTYSRSNPPPDYETDPTGATPFGSEALEDFLCAMAHFVWTVVNNILLYGRAWTDSVLSGLGLMQYLAGWVGRLLFAQTDLRRVALWAWGTVGLPSFNDIATITRAQFDVALTEWEAAREDVVCSLLGEDNPDGWKLSLETLLPLVFSESLVATAVSYFIPGAFFALIWNGLMKPDTWAGEECICLEPETYHEWPFTTTVEDWNRHAAADFAYVEPCEWVAAAGSYSGVLLADTGSAIVAVSPIINIEAGDYPVEVKARHFQVQSDGFTVQVRSADLATQYDSDSESRSGTVDFTFTPTLTFPGGNVRIVISHRYFHIANVKVGNP